MKVITERERKIYNAKYNSQSRSALGQIDDHTSPGEGGAGLENSTRPLVFTSVLGCRASEYFDISTEN